MAETGWAVAAGYVMGQVSAISIVSAVATVTAAAWHQAHRPDDDTAPAKHMTPMVMAHASRMRGFWWAEEEQDLMSHISGIGAAYFGLRELTCLCIQLPCSCSQVIHAECEQPMLLLRNIVKKMSDVCQVILHVNIKHV